MLGTAGEVRINSLVIFSYGLLHMDIPVLANQEELAREPMQSACLGLPKLKNPVYSTHLPMRGEQMDSCLCPRALVKIETALCRNLTQVTNSIS